MNNEFGLLDMNIVLKANLFDKSIFIHKESFLSRYCNGIFMNAFDYKNRKKLNCIDDIDTTLDTVYIVEYRIEHNNLFIEFYKNYVLIYFSKYLFIPMHSQLIPVIKKYLLLSDCILIGFEVDLFIDEYPDCINNIIENKSLHPLYINNHKGKLIFERYSGDKIMEKHIEDFLYTISGDVFCDIIMAK
jgi:hypothetical protein